MVALLVGYDDIHITSTSSSGYTEVGKGVGKGISNKRKNIVSESSEEEDLECLFSTETFSKDDRGEEWIKCCVCQRWGHEACAGIDSDDSNKFTCLDWCKITPGKRHLEL
ncbi:unnamed protein product [Euphydryas editha]|uniref:Uncharacterized protein n=1 Tax=Euphydryas editha TaxID=104508 RepID=A0AAU9TJQ7_EUPED|nr:unnamed protein product [Euphydryas editha]